MVVLLPAWLLDRILGIHRTRLDDLLTILFSSGSTGEPKGVMLSYRNISANVDGFRRGVDLRSDDRMLATLPFFHTFGCTVCLWAPLAIGMEAVFFPDPRAAKEVGELCRKHRCSIMFGTATFVRFYLRRSQPGDFDSLRLLVCGAEKLPVKLAEEFQAKFNVLPLEGYGTTELSPVVSTNIFDVEVNGLRQKANTMGTVGQPIPSVCAKAFDPETFKPLPPATEGVLAVKGPNVMVGYLHLPEKTREVVRDGWYITGDIGHVEEDGFIRITGRISRFAKIGGEMVPLERLDEEMHDILGNSGDRVLAVAAVPDEKRGERVVVLHTPEVGERLESVFQQLRDRGLPNLWIPDVRDCYPVESFPVLGTGKLDLKRVGELAKEKAGARRDTRHEMRDTRE
jgi:acyl-[acyl-carrier-protein]-phospholipid O-acyltransferase/long-chain-fatty-acid--[acyl-carrier-protein] ligase